MLPSLSGKGLFHPNVDSPNVKLPGCKWMLSYLFVDLLNLLKNGVLKRERTVTAHMGHQPVPV